MKNLYIALILVTAAFLALPALAGGEYDINDVAIAGQPTRDDLQTLANKGYTTVINLRQDGEFDEFDEAAAVNELGMKYVHIPVSNIGGIDAAAAEQLHQALAGSGGPVFLHCRSGGRAAGLLAIEQYLHQDSSLEEIQAMLAEKEADKVSGAVESWIESNPKQ